MKSRVHSRTSSPVTEITAANRRLENVTLQPNAISRRSSIEREYIELDVRFTQNELQAFDTSTVSVPLEPEVVIIEREEVSISNEPMEEEPIPQDTQSLMEELFGPEAPKSPTVFRNVTRSLSRACSVIWPSSRSYRQLRTPEQATIELQDIILFKLCRICLRDEELEPLVIPCACTISTSLVHRSCLIRDMKSRGKQICPICKIEYRVPRKSTARRQGITDKSQTWRKYLCYTIGILIVVVIIIIALLII